MVCRADPEEVAAIPVREALRAVRVLDCMYPNSDWHNQLTVETAIDAMYCLDRCTKQDIYKPKE